ncbi:MAG: hypothetical protein IH984_00435 [Planctomycetes bacterium]|nr:hypothetical protein [Planctomycetota bacterium]
MTKQRTIILAISIWLCAASALAQDQPQQTQKQELHWAPKLGLRVEQVNRAFEIVDRVVLVPDGSTYLDELSKWSKAGRWPVLIEDDHLAPMFIRKFKPKQVIRRQPTKEITGNIEHRQKQLETIVIKTWGGDPQKDSISQTFALNNFKPAGVVIASVNDSAWTAAVALAAGRGQPLAWLDDRFAHPNGRLNLKTLSNLRNKVDRLVAKAGYRHITLGDDIDTITICRAIAGKALTSANPEDGESTRAITDLLGRSPSGRRYAFTGWIFGDEARCAYIAMCSLFLDRSRAWLYDTYPGTGGWSTYGVTEAVDDLNDAGYNAIAFDRDRANYRAWQSMLPGGLSTDVMLMNSKGNADVFHLFSGKGSPGDIPILNEPLALHLIHSWSMRSPLSEGTVGAQWIAHGAYAYVGAVHEPFLGGFIPPKTLTARCMSYVPFLIASRVWTGQGQFSNPWKINTFGDPLMLWIPPRQPPIARLVEQADYGVDVFAHVRTLLTESKTDNTGETIARAIATLDLLGQDRLALEMWKLAKQRSLQEKVSLAAINSLFRAKLKHDFLEAFSELPYRTEKHIDMLWHLIGSRINPSTTDDTLLMLQSSIRPYQAHIDTQRLAPHLIAAFGQGHLRRLIQRQIDKAALPRIKKQLRKLLKKY